MIEIIVTGIIVISAIIILIKQCKKKIKGECGSCGGNCSCCSSHKIDEIKKDNNK